MLTRDQNLNIQNVLENSLRNKFAEMEKLEMLNQLK